MGLKLYIIIKWNNGVAGVGVSAYNNFQLKRINFMRPNSWICQHLPKCIFGHSTEREYYLFFRVYFHFIFISYYNWLISGYKTLERKNSTYLPTDLITVLILFKFMQKKKMCSDTFFLKLTIFVTLYLLVRGHTVGWMETCTSALLFIQLVNLNAPTQKYFYISIWSYRYINYEVK